MLLLTFDMLVFETLNLIAMQRLWGRKVGDLGFADFLSKAQWMARKLCKDLVKIDQWTPTTKRCSGCGHIQDVPLNVRIFACKRCGHTEDRDLNAAKSILEEGRLLRSGAVRKTLQEASGAITAESHPL